jgi:hypothetical protein
METCEEWRRMRRMQRRAHSAATNHRSDRRQQAMRGSRAGPRTRGATRSAKSPRGPLRPTSSEWFRGRTALRSSSSKDGRRCSSSSNHNSSNSSLRRRGRRRCADRNRLLTCGRERCGQRRRQVRFTFLLLKRDERRETRRDDLHKFFVSSRANIQNGQLPGTPRRRFCRILLPPLLRESQSLPLRLRFRLRHSQSP